MESTVDVFSRTQTTNFFPSPPVLRPKDIIPGQSRAQAQAELIYREIHDEDSGKLNRIGLILCKDMKIPAETLIPKTLQDFEA